MAAVVSIPADWQQAELAVDGPSLTVVLGDDDLRHKLAVLAAHCSGVVVSRSSPSQKVRVRRTSLLWFWGGLFEVHGQQLSCAPTWWCPCWAGFKEPCTRDHPLPCQSFCPYAGGHRQDDDQVRDVEGGGHAARPEPLVCAPQAPAAGALGWIEFNVQRSAELAVTAYLQLPSNELLLPCVACTACTAPCGQAG